MSVSLNIQQHSIDSSNWEKYKTVLQNLSQLASVDRHEASTNLLWKNWENNSSSLMYALVIEKRFDSPRGLFKILTLDDVPVACSGCYISDWSNQIMILGVRTWTNPGYRDSWWHGDVLLPSQIEFSQSHNCGAGVMTFNEHSAPLKKFIHRITQSKAVSLGTQNSEFYKDLIFYDQQFLIKNTVQTIVVKLLKCTKIEFEKKYLPSQVTK